MNTNFLRVLLLGLILVSLLQSMQGNMQKYTSVFSQLTEDDLRGFVFKQPSPTKSSKGFVFKQPSPTKSSKVCSHFTLQTNFSCVGCFSCESHSWGCSCCCCYKKCKNVTSVPSQ
ncbi:E6A protein [Equid gammaherpesvirus 2]|nr:E6A protein [Equid gammaherpesvirus 2]